MSRIKLSFRAIAVLAVGTAIVLACGPFFGIEALQNRKEVLLAPPSVSFEAELKALVSAPKVKLPVVEAAENDHNQVKQSAERPADELRQQSDGSTAGHSGEVFTPAIRLYTAGAVSFHHNELASAQSFFRQVLTLTAQERASVALQARYMLGRLAVQQKNQAEATTQFEAVRDLVSQGAPDEDGLAVASFGEQARGAWREGDVADAVELYARQASYGSQSGANSLVMIAALILKDPVLLDKAIQDSAARRLLFICLNSNNSRLFFFDFGSNAAANSTVDRIASALDRHQLTRVQGAGLLASAAYSQGRLDLAERFSALEDVPMSHWVMAKLALRKGDRGTALREYQRALNTFQPAMGDAGVLDTEVATLRVSRGDYVEALDFFYRSAARGFEPESQWNGLADYWGDAAYLAERVLTIEELAKYLNRTALPTSEKAARSALRSVLARRLMRVGRRREALAYFDDPKIRSAADQYDKAVERAHSWWRLPLTRAEARFTAAKLARTSGMDILGFEMEPDYAMSEGEYDSSEYFHATPAGPDQYKTKDEKRRVAASAPQIDVRFQYRLTAVEHATQAADLLPASSQAFASVLCQATEWVINREPNRAEAIYQRYLHQGAYVPWGRSFGRSCPEPNFAAASRWNIASQQIKHLTRRARRRPFTAGLFCVLLAGLITTSIYFLRAGKKR